MHLIRSSKPISTLPLEIVFWTLDRYKIETQFVPPSSQSYKQQRHVQWMAQSSLCSRQTLLSTSRRKTRLQCADMLWSSDLTRWVTDWHSQLNLLDLAQHSLTRLQWQPCDSCEIVKLCLRLTQTLACTLLSKLWKTCNSHNTSNNAH